MRMGTRLIWSQIQRRIKEKTVSSPFSHIFYIIVKYLKKKKKKNNQTTASYESIHRLVKSYTLTFFHTPHQTWHTLKVSLGHISQVIHWRYLKRGLTSCRQVVGFPSTTRRWRNPVKQATLKNASAVLNGRNEQVFHFNVWYWSWHYTQMKPDFLDYFIALNHFTFHCLWAIKRNGITLTFYLLYIIIFLPFRSMFALEIFIGLSKKVQH